MEECLYCSPRKAGLQIPRNSRGHNATASLRTAKQACHFLSKLKLLQCSTELKLGSVHRMDLIPDQRLENASEVIETGAIWS